MKNNFIYTLEDKVPFKHICLYGAQELFAILVATILIANITNISIGAGFIGAGVGTLIYILVTKGKSNVYFSNSGCYVAPVIFALSMAGGAGAFVGGVVVFAVYCLFGLIFNKISMDKLYDFLPKPLIATITVLIGLSLIGFVPSYIGDTGNIGTCVALSVATIIGLVMHYGKGRLKTIPFLVGIFGGYVICVILTMTGVMDLVDFSVFSNVKLIQTPTFGWNNAWQTVGWQEVTAITMMYIPYCLAAACEVWADHQAMSTVIGRDLIKENGIGRIFIAAGLATGASSLISGIPLASYGEGTGCTAASRVASARVTAMTSILLVLMGFCGPIQALMLSMPSVVFAGASIVLYPLIAIAGFKMLINDKLDLDNSKNMLLVSIPLSVGLGSIVLGGPNFSFSGTALALVVGVILNLILKDN